MCIILQQTAVLVLQILTTLSTKAFQLYKCHWWWSSKLSSLNICVLLILLYIVHYSCKTLLLYLFLILLMILHLESCDANVCPYKLFFNTAIVNMDVLPSWFLRFHYVHPSYTNKVLFHPHWNLQVDRHDGRTEARGPGRESPPVTVHQTCNDKDAQCMPLTECCVGWRSTGNQL